MTDLWYEASMDHETLAREAALDHVTAELDGIMPFLLAARSDQEFSHRLALASTRLETIAYTHGVAPDDVTAVAVRQYLLMREALMEGEDPLDEVLQSVHEYGSGPEEPNSHDLGPDFSHGYSEVPQGPPGGPDPSVTAPRFPGPEPLAEASASLRRQADYDATTPPDTGTGTGSQDIGVGSQDANGGQGGPPSLAAGGQAPGGVAAPPGIGQVTSSKDPVRMQVLAVAQSVRSANPWLPEHEVMRVARTAVGRYFTKTADTDWSPTIMSDAPPRQSGGDGGGSSGGGAVEHALEGQGLRSLLPGAGGAGGAGGAAELAEVAAL